MSNKTAKRKNKKEFDIIGLGRMGGDLRTMPYSIKPVSHAAMKGAR